MRAALVLTALAACAWPVDPVRYRLEYREPYAKVRVTIEAPPDAGAPRTLVMPRAIPMGYGEQHFDRYVSGVAASAEVVREEGPRWRLGPSRRVVYEVDVAAMEREILEASDTSKARTGYLGLLGYSVFGYLEGLETRPVEIEAIAPRGWPVFLTLKPDGGGRAPARDFYVLADSQIALGPGVSVDRVAAKAPLYLAVYAEGPLDRGLAGRLAAEALDRLIDYFGSAPFPHYTVHLELLKPVTAAHSYGFSMEHLDSATIFLSDRDGVTASSSPEEIARFRFNLAHHMAHSWIPKRCYGEGYFPFSWEIAPLLDTIWFAEGFGQYAAMAALAQGMPEPEATRFLDGMVERRFQAAVAASPPFLRRMPLIELSRVASTRYSRDFRTGRGVFARGGLMAAEMDARIRERTGGRMRLRESLRGLVAWSAKNGRAFRVDELPGLLAASTGVEVGDILSKWLAPLD
jgi:predicted metalloprotease with PDZ domain